MNSELYDNKNLEEGQCIEGERDAINVANLEFVEEKKELPKMLLHSCCGPCSTAVIERLLPDFDVTVFFYNPNVDDGEEYNRRREAQLKVISWFNNKDHYKGNVKYIEGEYEPELFLEYVKGYEDEPEGGARCSKCFVLRLDKTAKLAAEEKYDYFATTLTVSPHKNFDIIGEIGQELSFKYKVNFLNGNFKRKDGFKRSIELSKEMELYRQDYCGCSFSNWKDEK